jgi:DNA-binding response OmpR family regulator
VSTPTITSRLARRFILLSSDPALAAALRSALPEGWTLTAAVSLEEVGTYADILQHRFMLLDLDDEAFDALDLLATLRGELMLNIAVLTLGGDAARRDAARLARADRFFDRTEAVAVMRTFCTQYGW